jgi:hypothetical protein
MAMRLTAPAAFRYASSSVGDSAWTSAMLSKLALLVSSGRYAPALTSTASRSRMDASYSARFIRWKVREPGFRRVPLSTSCSSVSTSASRVSPVGRGMPGGGIISERSLRMTFSVTATFSCADSTL